MMVMQDRDVGARWLARGAWIGVSLIAMNQVAAAQQPSTARRLFQTLPRFDLVPGSTRMAEHSAEQTTIRVRVSIEAGPLEPALAALSKQVQLKLAYKTSLTENLVTAGAAGDFLPLEALAKLLENTGLTYRSAGTSTITLVNPRFVQLEAPTAPPGGVLLDELSVEAQRASAADSMSAASRLSAPYAGGQVARGGRIGLLGNVDTAKTPFNVTSYTDRFIRDQQASTVSEALILDPSVRATQTTGAPFDSFSIRGFPINEGTSGEIAFDGIYGVAPSLRVLTDYAERIEVLKGPRRHSRGSLRTVESGA